MQKVPFQLALGDREVASHEVNVRRVPQITDLRPDNNAVGAPGSRAFLAR